MKLNAPYGLSYMPFQEEGIRFAASRRSALIADEMGLGKTVQALGVINTALNCLRVLVVCPASLKLNWCREGERWLAGPLRIDYATSKRWPEHADVCVINYDILEQQRHRTTERPWDLVIYDEAHRLKNPKAKRTRLGLQIPARRTLFLTGTPMANRPIELWPILHKVSGGAFGSYHEFGLRYADARQKPVSWRTSRDPRTGLLKREVRRSAWDYSGASNVDELGERLGKWMIRRRKADVLQDLPPKRRQLVEIAGHKARVLRGADLHAAVAQLRESPSVPLEAVSRTRAEEARAKVPAAAEYLEDAIESSGQVIAGVYHRETARALADRLERYRPVVLMGGMSAEAKDRAVRLFQSGDSRLFIGQMEAAGEGLTLTASSHVVIVEMDWAPYRLLQFEDRAHRIGQRDSVLVQYLALDGTLDQRMARAFVDKQTLIDRTIDHTPITPGHTWSDIL